MAENIATLGIKVDSKDIKKLNDEFIKNLSLSGQVETSTKKITSSFKSTGEESKKLAKIEEGRITAVQRMISALADQEKKIALTKEGYNQYKLSLMGATEAEKKIAQEIISNTSAIQAAKKKENEIIKSNLASYKANIADQISLERQVVKEQSNRVNSVQKILSSLSEQEKKLTSTRDEIIKYNLALLGASDAEKKAASEMLGRIKNIKESEIAKKQSIIQEQKASKEASKIASDKIKEQTLIENAENKRTKSIDRLIQSLTMQEIKLRGGKAALTDYKLSLLGASDAERKQAKEILSKIEAINKSNKSLKDSISNIENIAKASGVIYAISRIGSSIKGLVNDLIDVTKTFQSMQISLNAATGGISRGAEAYSFLRKESEKLGLVFTDQIKGFSRIASAARGTALEGDGVREIYLAIAEASTVLQLSSDDTMGALKAVSDIMSKGTLQAEEIRGQLGDRLPGAFQIAARAMGMTTEELNKQLKAGKVLSEDFLPKFAKAIREEYAGSLNEASNSINANINRMENAWVSLKKNIYDAFGENTNAIIKDMTSTIDKFAFRVAQPDMQEDIKKISDGIRALIDVGLEIANVTIEFTKLIAPIKQVNDVVADGINPWKAYDKVIKEVAKSLGMSFEDTSYDTAKFIKEQGEQWDIWAQETEKIRKERNKNAGIVDRDADAIKKMSESLQGEIDTLSLTEEALLRKKAAQSGATEEDIKSLIALNNRKKVLEDEKEKEKERQSQIEEAIRKDEQRQTSINNVIAKLREQIATFSEGKEVSEAYQLKQLGAKESEILLAEQLGSTIDKLTSKKKIQEEYNKVIEKTTKKTVELSKANAMLTITKAFEEGLITFEQYQKDIQQINTFFNEIDTENADKEIKKLTASLDELTKFSGITFGNELADGINNAITSMQSFNKTLENNAKAEKELIKLQKELAGGKGSPEEREEALRKVGDYEDQMIKNSLSGYRQLFGTTSQLFKENTKERKALHTLEMAFAAAEIAMNLQKTISAAYTAIATQGSGDPYTAFARVAAMTALMGGIVAAAGGSLSGGGSASAPSSSMATQSSTALGSNDQSQSVSTAFSFLEDIESGQYNELKDISMSMKDLNKNITGLITSIIRTGGINDFRSVEGTSGGPSKLQNAAVQLVLGGPISFAGDAINKLTSDNRILTAIINPFIAIGNGISDWLNNTVGNISGALFGGSKKTTVLASGLQVTPGSIGSLTAGGSAMTQAFADIKTKKEGGLFGSDKTYFKTLTGEVDQSVQDMMTKVFQNMGQTMVAIAEGLGGQDMEKVYNYVFSVDNINLKDLDTEGINKALTEAISTASDQAAYTLFGELIGKYQQIGEGLLDTAVRIVAEKAIVLDIIDVTSKGFLGANIPEIAIETSQALINFAGSLDNLTDSFATYYDKFFTDQEKQTRLQTQLTESMSSMNMVLPNTREGFRQLVEVQNLHTEAGQQNYVTLLQLAEGADKYYTVLENTASETQKAIEKEWELANARKETVKKASEALQVEYLTAQGRSAEALALSRKIELESIDESLRPMKLRIWALQDATKAEEAATAAIEAEKKAIEEAAAARKSELENLIKTTVQSQIDGYQAIADAANEALATAEGLLRRSFEAEKNRITSAHEDILKGLTANLDEAQSAADSLRSTFDGLASARKSMTLAGTEQATYSQAQTQLMSALGMARQGDFTGAIAVSADTSALTQDTRGFYSSFEDYQREFFKTKNAITELENLTGDALSEQETMVAILQTQIDLENEHFNLQTTALDDQLDGILGVDKSVINLTDAITQYQEAQYAADGANTLLKTQTDYLNNMMMTLFDTNVKTGDLITLVDEYVHPEKYNDKATSVTTISNKSEETQKEMNDDLVRQIKILTDTMERGNYTIAKSTQDTAKTLKKWDYDGLPEVVA